MVLSEIKAVSGDMKIFVDCSMDDGRDVYKAMALGADAVSVGRGILPGLIKEGKDGVIKKVSRMNEELRELMGYTGVKNVSEFDPAVLWYHGRHFTDNN
jgi:isopentenyl diphosphate isomerase/L-lactate dehydrogenase-like FMN-dependent dehydrogenase